MGDIAVDIFLETLEQLTTNSKLFLTIGEKHQLQSLELEIKYMREFLRAMEKKRKEHVEVMNLVMQIKDVVFELENTVDQFVSDAYKQDHLPRGDKFFEWSSLRKLFHWDCLRELFLCKLLCSNQDQDHHSLYLESVNKEIKILTAKVKQIYDENMYGIEGIAVQKHSSTGSSGGGLRPSGGKNTSKIEEKEVVGFTNEVETLMSKLHDGEEGRQLEIISIIGDGGGGKTTLAREVYDRPLMSQKFEIRAWADVSQNYNNNMKKDLLRSIMESAFPGEHDQEYYKKCKVDELGEKVYNCLKDRKYFIVMDDIWDIKAWNDIQRSFPRESKGSKVLLTSRLPVQPDNVLWIPHYLCSLSESCSWELLQKKIYGNKQCPRELVDIGKQIAKECGGLPLAIVAIAGILATEDKTQDAWEKVANHVNSIIAKNQEHCMEILELSYNHLPLHLKACFLYIGGYPEDYEIPVHELIWLWIAEEFIQQSEVGESLEAIAKDYLISLMDRNLVTVARKSECHGGIKACRIHDLLRELCLKKAKEDKFLVQGYGNDTSSSCATNKDRRLFIDCTFSLKFSPMPHARNLRSFLYLPSSSDYIWDNSNLSIMVENFKLLRVLHSISSTSRGEIGMGDLFHLRYLALILPTGELHNAPNSFHYLPNLETFNLRVSCSVKISLPRHIVKMIKLRHLYTKNGIFEYHHVSNDEDEGNMFDSLQTLHRMCICEHCLDFLERTPNLRKLGLVGQTYRELPNLEFLKCIEILYVNNMFIGLKLPSTLTRLTLCSTRINWEKLSTILQTLPSLEVLKLKEKACMGTVWNTIELEEGFSQLKYLMFQGLDIQEWIASDDQFPKLEVLVIKSCRKLKRIPIDFADLKELRKIKIEHSRVLAEESARTIQKKQRDTKGDDDCLHLHAFANTHRVI